MGCMNRSIALGICAVICFTAVAAAEIGPRRMTLPTENIAKETYLIAEPGKFTVAFGYEYEMLEDARLGGEPHPNTDYMFTSSNTLTMEAMYGLSEYISLSVLVPFEDIQNTRMADSTVILGLSDETPRPFSYRRGARGMGDVIVMSYFRVNFGDLLRFGDEYYPASPDDYDNYWDDEEQFYAGKRQGPVLALALGVRLPTGRNDAVDDFGRRIPDDLQVGSGTMDPIVGLLFYHRYYRLGWGFSGLFRMSSQENIYHYEWGNEIVGTAYFSYRLSKRLELINQFNFTYLGRDKNQGEYVTNRGARLLTGAPSLVYDAGHGVSVQATMQVPLYQEFNELQLTSDYIVNLRTSIAVN